jgi:2-isopropylmalate synthase
LAVANSLASLSAGAGQIEVAINGLGERAGNAALEEVVMALHTRKSLYDAECRVVTPEITRASKLVYSTVGMMAPRNKPIVGANAFAHEAGIHQHGVMANRATYEIMSPASVGLSTAGSLVLGKHSGRHAFDARVKELGFEVANEDLAKYFDLFKDLCDRKKEVHDGDIEALIRDGQISDNGYKLKRFDMHSATESRATCSVTLTKEGFDTEDVALGNGPVDAAYNAIDKLVSAPEHELSDYSIRSVTEGKDALGEVIVKIQYKDELITGRGLSTDVMEASILAYLNGMNRLLSMRD